MHTSESEYQSTFTLREKMWCFVHAALKSCQERKKASLSLYLDIKALAHGDFSGLFFFIFLFIQICHQHGVYTRDHVYLSLLLYFEQKIQENQMKSNMPKESLYNCELIRKR
jgi:hypothetical protein